MEKVNDEMLAEYDFSGQKGVREKYSNAYKSGHTVNIYDGKKLVSNDYYAAIEPDVRAYFPDSASIYKALRNLISIVPVRPPSLQNKKV